MPVRRYSASSEKIILEKLKAGDMIRIGAPSRLLARIVSEVRVIIVTRTLLSFFLIHFLGILQGFVFLTFPLVALLVV